MGGLAWRPAFALPSSGAGRGAGPRLAFVGDWPYRALLALNTGGIWSGDGRISATGPSRPT
jgi:hypothetical protein